VRDEKLDTVHLQNLAYGYRQSATLLGAIEIDIFSKISAGARTVDTVARAADITPLNAERILGKCCNFEDGEGGPPERNSSIEVSGHQIEQLVDELILFANISVADPPCLPLVDHVHRFVSLNRSPGRAELAKVLLGLHSSFDRSMILLQDIVQVWHRSMAAAAAQDSLLFHTCNRRAVEAGLIGVDDAGLRMRGIAESLAEQAFGRRRIAQC
jgi:hypothetical protein